MVEEVKVMRNFRVTLPVEARKKLGLKVGDVLVVDSHESKIVFGKPVDVSKLKIKLGRKTDWKSVKASTREAGRKLAIAEGKNLPSASL